MERQSWCNRNAADAKETSNYSFDHRQTRTIINPTEVFSEGRISVVTQPTSAPPVRVEIYDQVYNLRGVDAEYILKLAEFVDGKMRTVGEQTSTIDSLRLAVLAALNIADEYHILKKKYDLLAGEFNRRAGQLAGALDEVLQDERRAG
jgi:cell division protein ZapA